MATDTVDQPVASPEYAKYAGDLSWDLNELSFRAQAALSVLHNSQEIDADRDAGLTLSYLLQGIAKRAEALAISTSNTERDYVSRIGSSGAES